MAKKTVEVICEILSERIQHGEFDEDRRLPSERTLSQQFMTTRITLREALRQLEAQGVIYREVRRGWFIAPPRLVYNPLHHSHFREMAQAQGRHTSTELISAGLQPASSDVAHQLGITPGSEIICIRRLRHVDGRAVLYVENSLNPGYFPGLLEKDLTGSLTDLYQRDYGLHYGGVRFTVFPDHSPPLRPGACMFHPAARAYLLTELTATSMGVLLTATMNTGAMMPCVLMSRLGQVPIQTGHPFIPAQHKVNSCRTEVWVRRAVLRET